MESTPMDTTSASVLLARSTPDEVWRLVSDVTRTGEWSPENTGGRWVKGATGPVEGARFVGGNRNGVFRWWTSCVVVAAVPGRRFAFDVSAAGIPVARWDWTLQPAEGGGTEVTLGWTDRRSGPAGWAMRRGGAIATGATIDRRHVARNIEVSLDRLGDLLAH
jgi:Polyketide cyclase / dehydrase and lipid transport